MVTTPALAESLATRLIERVEAQRAELFAGGDGARGLVAAVATTEGLHANDADKLGKRLGQAMKAAKAAGKSGLVVWAPPPAAS